MKPSNIGSRWRTPPKEPKANEPTTRDKLSASFLKALQSDFETYGVETIEKLRAESPSKYAELAAKLVTATEPREPSLENSFENCRNMHEVGKVLLKAVGFTDPDDNSIEQAIKANDAFIDRLHNIYQCALASEEEVH